MEWLQEKDASAKSRPPQAMPAAQQRVFAADQSNLVHGLVALGIGGVIAVPTDTLYGEGSPIVNCQESFALRRLE